MLLIISPAKTLDFETPLAQLPHSQPEFVSESEKLITKLRTLSRKKIGELMSISPALASLNHQRYQQWHNTFEAGEARQALLAFKGEVYRGLAADTFSEEDLNYAQNHLRILSGLHGVLRPLDLIHPYRLEMGTRLPVRRRKNLYHFWDDTLTKFINRDLETQTEAVLVNLASQEYFKAVHPHKVKGRILNIHFKEWKNGELKVIMTFAKHARGLMAAYLLRNRIETAEEIKGFDVDGYGYNDRFSTENDWVFTRE
ncbi:MAG: peroxide stress protein YaaA [Salibacteraceae bacterium]